ncbi:restriction endonuclease subunit S [Leptotrichia sp.]|uniref:restriction endonuclease subunit S n=1 Tax=Leptotrichia sp. TaxID=104608 RepID=UPI001812D7A2|nr:restriction endonuclease subunit S [Leptotrichia sp.]MBB1535197.1 restriction endonuclease subunit S [Leptotrichia sp.]
MDKRMLGDLIISYNNKRKALNNVERNKKKEGKLYPYYGANGVVDYINEYMIEDEVLCIAEDGGSWGKNEKCSYIVSGKFWVNNHAHVVKTKKELDMRYLMYFLNFENLNRYITGTTRGKLTKNSLEKIKISIPSFDKQKEIVRNLEKIKKIIELKKIQLLEIENLKKSQFFEMFGDPIKNEKGWRIEKWKNLFKIQTGKLNSNAMVEGGKYPFFTCAKEIFSIDKYYFDCEALILAGNNADGIYDVKYYNGKFNAYQRTYVINLINKEYNYIFFKFLLESKLKYLKEISKGSSTRYLTMSILSNLKFILPETSLQNKFATKIEAIQKLKFEIEKSLKETENLYNSLMQKFFSNK